MMVALKGKDPKKAKIRKPVILVYGKPGVGKTWAAMDFPDVYYIDCEGGATLPHYTDKLAVSGASYLGKEDGADDINLVLNEIRALATQKHKFKTVVIDSLSEIFNAKILEKAEQMERSGTDMDKTFGREKKPAISALKQMLTWFGKLDMNVILICHEKDLWKDGKQVGVTFDAHDKLEYSLDLVLRITKQGNARKAIVGKNRLEQFTEGEVIDWSYEEFANRYGRKVIESDVHNAGPAATPDQVQKAKQLAEVFGLPEETKAKWFDKAGADSWEEMTSQEIQACIDYFKKQMPELASS